MASTNKTPNYNLSQFIATDKPAWLTDYNGDMSKVDTAVKNVSDRVGVNETAITEAEANIEDNASNITTLQASSSQHGTDITDLKAQDIIIKNDVTNLGTRVTALENKENIKEITNGQIDWSLYKMLILTVQDTAINNKYYSVIVTPETDRETYIASIGQNLSIVNFFIAINNGTMTLSDAISFRLGGTASATASTPNIYKIYGVI